MSSSEFDIILAGGGLANALIAWRLQQVQPELRVCLLERGEAIGADHTWSFHGSDLTAAQLDWLQPLIARSWPRQEVRFPGLHRMLETSYHTITSTQLDGVATAALGERVRLRASVAHMQAGAVTLEDGTTLTARAVLDGRGPGPAAAVAAGYQTFLGLEVELEAPHGIDQPVIMDATVEQFDGYRFIYLLPFDDRRLLIEDTYYNTHAGIDLDTVEARIGEYMRARNWQPRRVIRREHGILPIVMAGSRTSLGAATPAGVTPVGVRAGLFHTVTGYSLPFAVELADRIAALALTGETMARRLDQTVTDYASLHWQGQAFDRLLARLLFVAARPSERQGIFKRFYGLSNGLIERFYAGKLLRRDKLRILIGKPPTSVLRAIPCLWPGAAFRARDRLMVTKETM